MTQKIGSATRKIPAGKLVRVDVIYSDQIDMVKITGDFFLHPEETLDEIVDLLTGQILPLDSQVLTKQVDALLVQHEAQLIGASSRDIVDILQEAVQ